MTYVLEAPLTRLVALPLIGAAVIFCLPRRGPAVPRLAALLVAAGTAVAAFGLLGSIDPAAAADSVAEDLRWIETLGARYALGLDGLSFVFVGLASALGVVAILGSWTSIRDRANEFYAALLSMVACLHAVFLARDLLLFFVAWEAMLLPMYLLIAVWGGPNRRYAATKFVAFTLAGSLPMLLAILGLHIHHLRLTGHATFDMTVLAATDYPPGLASWCFAGFLLAFAIKIPVWPLHTWLPDAHTEAPTAGSILLAGLLLKMGLYGLLRIGLPFFPEAAAAAAPWMISLGIAAVLWGAWASAAQDDLKRLVAFSSVAHMGVAVVAAFAAAGGAARPEIALMGAAMVGLNHGISTGALFLAVGFLYDRAHAREIAVFGGLARTMPRLATLLGIVVFSSAALPGTNGFVGEVLAIAGAFRYRHLAGAAVATTAVWSAVYLLRAYRAVVWGPARADAAARGLDRDLDARETCALGALAAAIVLVGVYPLPILDLLDAPLGRVAEVLAR